MTKGVYYVTGCMITSYRTARSKFKDGLQT
jgi:hypothetical protein